MKIITVGVVCPECEDVTSLTLPDTGADKIEMECGDCGNVHEIAFDPVHGVAYLGQTPDAPEKPYRDPWLVMWVIAFVAAGLFHIIERVLIWLCEII